MRKSVVLSIVLMSVGSLFGQDLDTVKDKDYSLARVGRKRQGVSIFLDTEPLYKYNYVATINAKLDDKDAAIDKMITKAKKKYPYFNGLIFDESKSGKADLIQFKEPKMTYNGFVLGQEVLFTRVINTIKSLAVGVIYELDSNSDKAIIQYKKSDGTLKIINVLYTEIKPKK